jgi:hypothetical protein
LHRLHGIFPVQAAIEALSVMNRNRYD